jgi:FtsZ-binding cell division protein ZapB
MFQHAPVIPNKLLIYPPACVSLPPPAPAQIQALANRKALLQSTVQDLKASGAELAAKLDNLLTEVTAMTTNNQQLKAANREVKAQVQALVLQLQHAGVSVA